MIYNYYTQQADVRETNLILYHIRTHNNNYLLKAVDIELTGGDYDGGYGVICCYVNCI